ncbi:hypothetical protein GT037_004898 [Alternaria burnsii]|uniref:U1-type domain-containing protein n=1 Tax=Alternaria burnsii TaxID=1187904 RepID=A0A8H7EEC4_9PLEO|nr:uncharacterized protein GT037_004898 [Alternaria burnsii]KAF7676686.1 hypothetical protein GT037_004898 [Alternaria burnsii]CAI9633512.1 unnamed protein product [Alternaria burnsii]
MDATLVQRKRDALTLLSGMLTSVLQGDFPVTNRLSAQPAFALNALSVEHTTISETNANERDVFKTDMNDLDLGPSSESEASSDEDRPIRSTRQLKSEVRRLKVIIRRANRRTTRRAARIAKHLDPSQAAAVFDSLGGLLTPLQEPQHVTEDTLDKRMTGVASQEGDIAEASDSALINLEATSFSLSSPPNSPPSPTPISTHNSDILAEGTSWLCKPCNSSYTHLDDYRSHKWGNAYHQKNVADYKRLRPTYREEEDDVEQVPSCDPVGHYCVDCDFRTPMDGDCRRHLRSQWHASHVARKLQRRDGVMKKTKSAPMTKGGRPQQYCKDCDSWSVKINWDRHLKGPMHVDNVAKNLRLRSDEEVFGETEKVGDWVEADEMNELRSEKPGHYCKDCDRFYATQNWSRHLKGSVHASNVLKNKHCDKSIVLPTPPDSIVEVEGLETLPTEQPERYCEACDIYPGVRWARHVASPSHSFNAIRFPRLSRCTTIDADTKGDEDITEDESIAEDSGSLKGVERSSSSSVMELVKKVRVKVQEKGQSQDEHEEPEHYCEDCDCRYSGSKWERHLTSDEHIENVERSMVRDGIQCDEDEDEDMQGDEILQHEADVQISSHALTSPASSSLPPTPVESACPEYYVGGIPPHQSSSRRPSGKQDWYCDMCDANVSVSSTWAIGVHMAEDQEALYEKWRIKSLESSKRF